MRTLSSDPSAPLPSPRLAGPNPRRVGWSPPSARREPFDRLKFWTVRHELRKRLTPYEASNTPSPIQGGNWNSLRYWMLLLDEDDEALITFAGFETVIPDPDVWFGRVKT